MPATWSSFRRRDLSAAVRIVREVAASGDAGVYGHGVEVVLESPRLHWWQRIFDRAERDQARIAVTSEGGTVGYPMHVRLVTGYGSDAAKKVDRRDNWATSVTSMRLKSSSGELERFQHHPHGQGEAIIMLKRGTTLAYDPAEAATEVVAGTVAALDDLHPFTPDRGWRARIDRGVLRS